MIIYYVFGGDQEARRAAIAGYAGTLGAASTFGVIFLITWLSTKIGKRQGVLLLHRRLDRRLRAQVVLLQPRAPLLLLLPAPLHGVRAGRAVHADGLDDRRRGGRGRTRDAPAARGDVRLDLLVGGEAGHGGGARRRRLPAQRHRLRRGAGGRRRRARTIVLMRLCDALIPVDHLGHRDLGDRDAIRSPRRRRTRCATELERRRGSPGPAAAPT